MQRLENVENATDAIHDQGKALQRDLVSEPWAGCSLVRRGGYAATLLPR